MTCGICEVEFPDPTAPSRINRTKYCSKACADKGRPRTSAKARGDALRGRGKGDGYIKLMGRHEHRVVMEEKLGRKLDSSEIVHHIDGDKHNNLIENLEIMTRAEHARHHINERLKCQN